MLLLNKIWIWIKSYWYFPVLLIAVIFSAIFLFKNQTAYRLLLAASENYKKQIEALQKLWEEERKRKEDLQKQYELTIRLIETKYQTDQKVLEESEKKRVKELVNKYQNKPEELSKQLAEAYGIKYGE